MELVVKVGQIWESKDPRATHPRFKVIEVDGAHAVVEREESFRVIRVKVERLEKGKHYRLITAEQPQGGETESKAQM